MRWGISEGLRNKNREIDEKLALLTPIISELRKMFGIDGRTMGKKGS